MNKISSLLSAGAAVACVVSLIPAMSVAAQAPDFVMVPVDSGTSLATDVWLPAGEAPGGWPVVMRRTPYGRVQTEAEVAWFLGMGYAYVSQDVRGRGDSEGRFLPFLNDAADGKAAIEWVKSQPWSNGRICTWGGSAEGVVQLMAAGENPDGLVCAIVSVATDDIYDGMLPGGAWRQELTTAWLHALDAKAVWDEWRVNEACGPYWDTGRLTPEKRGRIHHPMLLVGGFFDIFSHCQLRMHRDFRNQVAPDSRADQFLVQGPWTHGGISFDEDAPVMEGDVTFIRSAAYNLFYLDIMDFLDWNLKDGDRPAWAPVRYFRTRLGDTGLTATGTWRTVDEWPPAGNIVQLHLNNVGVLSPETDLQASAVVSIPVNPADPVPSVCGGNLTTKAGICDQAVIDARPDVAVFQTAPVERDTYVEGDVTARIRVTFSSDDGDVVVRLSQVTPTGAVMLLADGVVRARYMSGCGSPVEVVPGESADLDVKLSPVAFELPAGHALRIAVSGTSSPRYEVNPGHFVPLSDKADLLQTELGVVTGHSYVTLTVTNGDQWAAPPDTADDVIPDNAEVQDVVDPSDVSAATDISRDAGTDHGPNLDVSATSDTCVADSSRCECPESTGCQAGYGKSQAGLGHVVLFLIMSAVFVASRRFAYRLFGGRPDR